MELRVTLYSRDGDGVIQPPRTKKNSGDILCPHEVRNIKFHSIQPSPQYRKWEAGCKRAAIYDRTAPAITYEVNCSALIYRDRNSGDAVGYYQAIADCLEHLGIVQNDRLIVSWDGTRLDKDAINPRVEVTLTAITGAQHDLGLGLSAEETRKAAIAAKRARSAARKAARG